MNRPCFNRLADSREPMPDDKPTTADVAAGRMQRKLDRRDQRIAGLVRRVAALEHTLATQVVNAKRWPEASK